MALDFPSNPQVDDEYQSGSTVWKWNGDAWVKLGTEGPQGPQGAQGAQGEGVTTINQFLLMGA